MAKNLGIKPGSKEFHALKNVDDMQGGKGKNKNNKDKGNKGKNKEQNKGKGKGNQ